MDNPALPVLATHHQDSERNSYTTFCPPVGGDYPRALPVLATHHQDSERNSYTTFCRPVRGDYPRALPVLATHQQDSERNSYTTFCPPMREDNPRALARGLSPVQADKVSYTTIISADLAQCEILPAI